MDWINQLLEQNSNWRYLFIGLLFFALFILLVAVYNFISKKLQHKAKNTDSRLDDFIIRMFRVPAIWIIFAILLTVFSEFLKSDVAFFQKLQKVSQILLILAIGWLVIQFIRAAFRYYLNKLDMSQENNLQVRKRMTQLSMIEKILIVTAGIVFVSIALMSIDALRNIGVSALTSAGVLGIIVGLAAQRSVGQVLSGIQIALTQPIRLDDVVVVNNEWGRIEEINITYVVVKIWDERRLIVPVDYFLQNPIANWTRTTSNIMGTVYLYVAYNLPLEPLRDKLGAIVKGNPKWDGRAQNIQVTDSKEWYKEIRILVSSANSSDNWDLRVEVREKMIDFINEQYPGSFAKMEMKNLPPTNPTAG
ncbi:MAG: mechanosensitive ion channel [Petrimonas sp.]|nr:mechanosensitive ion channel [Petrimonas sp.]